MLDTNICIYIIKKRPSTVLTRFQTIASEDLYLSVMTVAELQYGVDKSNAKSKNQEILDDFISRLQVLPWEETAGQCYSKIRNYLEAKGTPIGNMDMLIAAHCQSQNYTLVTNNIREFERIPDLKVENWV
ncbi:type II toxin-antitoxin system tRNA(fMet)-specific endonuclease VapC [Crocosphaera sp.]|uniref:type II toxin-antitoxin system tRNA(fMet)-specific endonuclease VapC n=1 Tax=Crocosphaera sp. TaxID=2729996 RepID=UPI003F211A59